MPDWSAADAFKLGAADPASVYAALATLLERPPWHRDALCAEPAYAGVNFFPRRGEDAAAAQAVCLRCSVVDECARAGIEGDEAGVWGATTGRQRRPLRAALGLQPLEEVLAAHRQATEQPRTDDLDAVSTGPPAPTLRRPLRRVKGRCRTECGRQAVTLDGLCEACRRRRDRALARQRSA